MVICKFRLRDAADRYAISVSVPHIEDSHDEMAHLNATYLLHGITSDQWLTNVSSFPR
jgi:hypothetical protein